MGAGYIAETELCYLVAYLPGLLAHTHAQKEVAFHDHIVLKGLQTLQHERNIVLTILLIRCSTIQLLDYAANKCCNPV